MLQEFVPFLDKNNYQIVRFFEFLLEKDDFSANYKEIEDALNISSYKLQEIISAIHSLGHEIKDVSFSVENNKVTFTGLDTVAVRKVILHEVRRSIRFKVFLHAFLNPHDLSDKEFQKREGISRATYFRIKNKLLHEIGSDLIKKLSTNEVACRFYIFNVLYYFSYLTFPNASVKKRISNTINRAIIIAQLSPTNCQHKQYLYFGIVNFCRDRIGRRLSHTEDKHLVQAKMTSNTKKFMSFFSKTWPLAANNSFWYVRIISTFLLATGTTSQVIIGSLKNYGQVEKLTSKQMSLVHDFLRKDLTAQNDDKLTKALANINAKILVPFFFNNSYQSVYDQKYYAESYTTVDKLAKLLITIREKFQSKRSINQTERVQLYYSYLFVLMSEIPQNNFSEPVHIAVDFSQGFEYTNYIKEKVSELTFLNVKLDNFINPKTDIYVANNIDPSFKNKQIVWDHPPLSKDMLQLHDSIIQIKKEKNI